MGSSGLEEEMTSPFFSKGGWAAISATDRFDGCEPLKLNRA